MQILLANAKIMFGKADRKPVSAPLFQSVADTLAAEMARMDVEELSRQLDCSKKIAAEKTGDATTTSWLPRRCLPCLPTTVRHTSICVPTP